MIMIKKLTGRTMTAIEFRPLNQCLQCGYASDKIQEGELCADCKLADRKKCEYCEIVLRHEDKKIYYAYDNNDELRDEINEFKASKKLIREFRIESEVNYKPFSENLCQQCHDTQEDIKINYLKMNRCVSKDCRRILVDNPTVESITKYLGQNGMYCRRCLYDMCIFPDLFNY